MKNLILILFSIFILSACDSPPDVPVFEDLQPHMGTNPANGHIELRPDPACEKAIKEPACGHGVYIMSKKEIFVGEQKANYFNGKPWSVLKAQSIYLPAQESYAPLATYIINQCKKSNCSDQVDRFKVRLDELKSIGTLVNGQISYNLFKPVMGVSSFKVPYVSPDAG